MTPFTFTYRGLTFGEGTEILVEDEIGGLRSVTVDSGSRPAPQFAGAIPGRHVPRAVDIVFPLRVFGRMDDGTLGARLEQCDAAFQPHPVEEFPLTVRLFEDEWLIWVRPLERRELVAPTSYASGAVPYRVALERTDPHWYGTQVHSVPIPVYSISGGGVDLPDDLPFDLGAATEQHGVAVNAGNADAYPLVRIQRPAGSVGTFTGFTLTNTTTDDDPVEMVVNLSAGQTLFMDFFAYVRAERGVDPIRIDNASRFSGWQHPRTPLRVAPPGANFLRLDVDGTATDTVALATYRDTSL